MQVTLLTFGTGPEPILVKELSVESLANAVVEVESKAVRERAQAIGQRIRGEDRVGPALKLIESHMSA